jgi:uncharacterized membrane protein YfcA
MNDPRLAIAGLLIGILVGMTGMGGGSLMTPILIFLFNFNPSVAIGTDILHGAVFKSVGAARHRRLGTVRIRLGIWMLAGSAPMSLVGVWVATYLTDRYGDSADSVQGRVLGAMLVVGTDIFHAAALLWVAGLGHFLAGNVELVAVGWLLVGSIPGVLIGSQISVGMPERVLRLALAAALILSGVKLLDVPYANMIVVVGLAVGFAALGVWGLTRLLRTAESQASASAAPPAQRTSRRTSDPVRGP